MVRWVVGSIPLSYFSLQPVHHEWYNKGRDMCYLVCGMVHIKETLLLIEKSSPCGGTGFLSCYLNGPITVTKCVELNKTLPSFQDKQVASRLSISKRLTHFVLHLANQPNKLTMLCSCAREQMSILFSRFHWTK